MNTNKATDYYAEIDYIREMLMTLCLNKTYIISPRFYIHTHYHSIARLYIHIFQAVHT